MSTLWLGLLAGCVLFGALVVAALVLPRSGAAIALAAAVAALGGATAALGAITDVYTTGAALGLALVVLLGGVMCGYAIGATSLPHLARAPRIEPIGSSSAGDAVVLLGDAEPERYDMRAVAHRQRLFADSAELDVPPTALPFVFFADRARYRAAGRLSPAAASARELARLVQTGLDARPAPVCLAWAHFPGSLARTVATEAADGASAVAVVALGDHESGALDEARAALDGALRAPRAPRVAFGPPVWHDAALPGRLVERILHAAGDAPRDETGVVLVASGRPSVWEHRYAAATQAENYFNQRVRALLADSGVDERLVRLGWIVWQTPDVTESVRHLAVLGCTRIVVAPSTIALPSLETVLDLRHAIALARVPERVSVIALEPWGADEAFAAAVARSADAALAELHAQA